MRLVIVGASGVIGRAVTRAARTAGVEIIGTARRHGGPGLLPFDVCTQRLDQTVPDLGPDDRVLVLAAHIDPNWILDHPREARELNVTATCRCLDDALARGCHVTFLSSEAVFGQDTDVGHDETTPPVPLTLYARLKVEVEEHLAGRAGAGCVVRTGWIVPPDIAARCPVQATYQALLIPGARMAHDNRFSLTSADDVATGIVAAIRTGHTGILHLAAEPPVRRTELARWIIEASSLGSKMCFKDIDFSTIVFREPRPRQSWLDSRRARQELGITFTHPYNTVIQKVGVLDQQQTGLE